MQKWEIIEFKKFKRTFAGCDMLQKKIFLNDDSVKRVLSKCKCPKKTFFQQKANFSTQISRNERFRNATFTERKILEQYFFETMQCLKITSRNAKMLKNIFPKLKWTKIFFDNVTFRISFRNLFVSGKLRFEVLLWFWNSEILILWFWKHTFQNVYVSTFDGLVLFVLEEYCFEIVGCGSISINAFIFSGKIVCAVLSFLKLYIRDFIRSKNIFSKICVSLKTIVPLD